MKKIIRKILPVFDVLITPLVYVSLLTLKLVRKAGTNRMKYSKNAFINTGIYPVQDHYYEPLYNPKHLRKPLNIDRELLGIDFNVNEQLEIINSFHFQEELLKIPLEKKNDLECYYNNTSFEHGDAEYLYSILRHLKPNKIIEIGSGNSTLFVSKAINKNKSEDAEYTCEHICIEPYEMEWLDKLNVKLIREKVEECDLELFKSLKENDILFIDSSHIIRSQGDVLFEILEILPVLNSGVYIHFHDIFTPRDYPDEWVRELVRMWNEQYILEAFLSNNSEFKIISALNFLKHHYPNELFDKCPVLKNEPQREPGSFWIMKK